MDESSDKTITDLSLKFLEVIAKQQDTIALALSKIPTYGNTGIEASNDYMQDEEEDMEIILPSDEELISYAEAETTDVETTDT